MPGSDHTPEDGKRVPERPHDTGSQANEALAHLAGDMGQHFMAIGQGDTKHGARQNLSHRPDQFNWFFFGQAFNNSICCQFQHLRTIQALRRRTMQLIWHKIK